MISELLYNTLSTDSSLLNLLNASEADNGIYFETKKRDKSNPFIIYYLQAPTNINAQENVFEQQADFSIYADTHSEAAIIRDRLYDLFNKFDKTRYATSDGAKRIIEGHALTTFSRSSFLYNPKTSAQLGCSFSFKFVVNKE